MGDDKNNPRLEPGIGRRLERAREGMGLSLREVEQETRIRSRYLRDLEREDFDVLPAVYVLGSLKTYADFLGLDGAALSRQLKASLVEPDEPDVPAQLGALGGTTDEDDEYEAAPVPAVGFDQLFLGMGVILISILAIMTLAAAVAQGDSSPVSQINQPSTPEAPSEIALAGNVQDGDNGAEEGGTSTAGNKEDGPEASRGDQESKHESEKDGGAKEDQDSSQASSVFGDAEFVPMSPSSSTTASAPAASASAASASAASASAASASAVPQSSPAPATDAPAATASTSAPSASAPVASAPADTAPADTAPEPASAGPGSAGAEPAPVASGGTNRPGSQAAGPGGPDTTSLAGGITDQVRDAIGPLR